MGDGVKNGENGFLRILFAEEDDVGAFVAHCEINKLPYACSIQRITNIEEAREKIPQFNPRLILVGESYATPGFVSTLRRSGIALPIICIVRDRDTKRAEELLQSGATDSLFTSQMPDLARCLDSHLSGKTLPPFYSEAIAPSPSSFFSLNSDRFKATLHGAWVRTKIAAVKTGAGCRKLAEKSRFAWVELRVLCSNVWKKIKVVSLVKTADLIASTKARLNSSRIHASASPTERETLRFRETASRAERKDGLWSRSGETFHGDSDLNSSLTGKAPRDNTLRQEAEADNEAFRTLELAFKTLFHTSLDGLFLLDNSGAILHANAAACATFGMRMADLLGKKLLDFVQPQNRSEAEAAWEMLLTLASHESDLSILNGRGERKDVHIRGRTNLWFGVHLLILKENTARPISVRDSVPESSVSNAA